MEIVSIIVPVYNAELYLEKCILSILAQDYKEFELILVDDGSTDGSGSICDKYCQIDSRVKVIHKINEGVSIARNTGISVSCGKYISFVDSDDYIDEKFLSKAVDSIRENQCDLFICGIVMEYWSQDSILNVENISITEDYIGSMKDLLEKLEISYPLMSICGPWCKLYHSDVIKKEKISFDTSISFGEDTRFNIDYYSYINKVSFDHTVLYHYRRGNGESLFSKFKKDTFELHQEEYSKMYGLICEKHCEESFIGRYLGLYVSMLQGCINEYYRFFKKTTYLEKRNLVKKISNDALVNKCKINNITKLRNKIVFVLLKIKAYDLILLMYFLFFKYRKTK